MAPDLDKEILLAPEGYTVAEILGDLEGEMTSDREILVICRKEEEPPLPAAYRVRVRYLEEETREPLREDYVSDEIEEGMAPDLDKEILLAPEGYTVAEILGDLEGEMTSDREILVICRKEEEPPLPAAYRIRVRYLEEETREPLREDYVSDEIEEGMAPDLDEEILLAPEGYIVAEIKGDLEGEMTSDREILVICRKAEGEVQDPEDPQDPEGGGEEKDPEDTPEEAGGTNSGSNSSHTSHNGSGSRPGKNTGKTSGKNTGNRNGSSRSTASTGVRTAGAAPSAAPQAAAQSLASIEESEVPQILFPEETVLPMEEAAAPTETAEEAPAPAAESAETEVAALTGRDGDAEMSELGGAVLTRAEPQKEGYPLWSVTLSVAEGGILVVLGYMIVSDMKLLMWLKEKKRR